MRAMLLHRTVPPPEEQRAGDWLDADDVATPTPDPGQLLVRVSVCGVCRTDLDVVQGRLSAPRYPLIPGHQIIGHVAAAREANGYREGDRVGVAWIFSACGHCRWCRSGRENLCPEFRGTGCHANGGYAEYVAVPAAFAYRIDLPFADAEIAPLLCAGAIGWRSLRLANLTDGEPLGLTGFGASAHLVLQLARQRYPGSPVFVFARNADERRFARELGAAWSGDTADTPPEALAAIIDTTPAWRPVVSALAHLAPGGRLVINAIRKSDADKHELARLDYATHLWMEREIKSVANVTRRDVQDMLAMASLLALRPTVRERPLADANAALAELAGGAAVHGATVLRIMHDAG